VLAKIIRNYTFVLIYSYLITIFMNLEFYIYYIQYEKRELEGVC